MSAYLICMVRVEDPETYKRYAARTPDLVHKHGGRFLVRGGEVTTLEGPEFKDRLVVLEFPSKEAIEKFHASDEYQEVMKIRQSSSESTFLAVEGAPEGVVAPEAQVTKSG